MSAPDDRLWRLLPAHHRARDEETGAPLRALLRVMADEAGRVEEELWTLLDDWFVETASEEALERLGALVGWRPAEAAPAVLDRAGLLSPRREIAEWLGWRARAGTLALLEEVVSGASGWPARAVEGWRGLAWLQHLDHQRPRQGRLPDLRRQERLDRIGGPFDTVAHLPDLRRPQAARSPGRHGLANVVVFLCRLPVFGLRRAPARRVEGEGAHAFAFSALGNDAPLFNAPAAPREEAIEGERALPLALRRRALAAAQGASPWWYGEGRAIRIWAPGWRHAGPDGLVPPARIVPFDLSGWRAPPPPGKVALDPERGRFAFNEREAPRAGARVRVAWHYGFPAAMGGGPYRRDLATPAEGGAERRTVGRAAPGADHPGIAEAIAEPWTGALVVEVLDSEEYTEPLEITVPAGASLEIRAAQGERPLIRLLDRAADALDALVVRGGAGGRLVLDGLLVAGRGLRIEGPPPEEGGAQDDLCEVVIRDTTLVPGWDLEPDCRPACEEPSLEIQDSRARVLIQRSILGPIAVAANEALTDPVEITLEDSILDAVRPRGLALFGRDAPVGFVRLAMRRSTATGRVLVHEAGLVEDSILLHPLTVARRQRGCVRFSWLAPGSRAPRRFAVAPEAGATAEQAAVLAPRFASLRYGRPDYLRLLDDTPAAVRAGASDGGEMGAFHDSHAALRARRALARAREFSPARLDLGLVFAS